jgi:hypothetical protein
MVCARHSERKSLPRAKPIGNPCIFAAGLPDVQREEGSEDSEPSQTNNTFAGD